MNMSLYVFYADDYFFYLKEDIDQMITGFSYVDFVDKEK